MIRSVYPGASYIDAWPDGEMCRLYEGSHIETHLGRVTLPEPIGLLFLRCSPVKPFHFAGKGHESGLTWEYIDGLMWKSFPSPTGRGCYDHSGAYQDALPAGLQYCADDGSMVSRIDSYPTVDGLNEWTITSDLRIGQGHESGVCVFADGHLREIEPGYCIFVNVNRVGERVTISFWKAQENCAVVIQTTLSELRSLPPISAPVVIPPPAPTPVPKPEPKPVSFSLPSTIKDIRDRYVAQYPVPQGRGMEDFDATTGGASSFFEDKARKWTREMAETIVAITGDATYGVKNAGGGRPQSKDSLAHNDGGKLINFDLLSGVGTGHPTLVNDPSGEDITGQVFMPVAAINHLSGTLPNPGPVEPKPGIPPSVDLSEIRIQLSLAFARLDGLVAENAALKVRVQELEQKPAPVFTLPALKVMGKTRVSGWHQHEVDLLVVEVK